MEKRQKQALENLLYYQLGMIQEIIAQTMKNRKKIGDEKYHELIEKWSNRETEVRSEISKLI